MAATGTEGVDFKRGLSFTDLSLMLDATTQGQGVALVNSITLLEALATGQLLKPFNLDYPLNCHYCFVTQENRSSDPKI